MDDEVQGEDDLVRNQLLDEDEPDQSGIAADSENVGLDPNFREALKTNEDFRLWFALMAAFAALIGLGLLYIFAQIFIFKKQRFWLFSSMGYLSGDLRSGNGQSSETACEKPPEYEDVVKPPSYEEIMSSNRGECEISTATV